MSALKEKSSDFSYTYTDISSEFFQNAKARFSEFEQNMNFSVWNIELDPKTQGFAPNKYDVILAVNVLHATKVCGINSCYNF